MGFTTEGLWKRMQDFKSILHSKVFKLKALGEIVYSMVLKLRKLPNRLIQHINASRKFGKY